MHASQAPRPQMTAPAKPGSNSVDHPMDRAREGRDFDALVRGDDGSAVAEGQPQSTADASLAKANTALMGAEIFEDLSEEQRLWAQPFHHPILEDLAPERLFYCIEELPELELALITEQAQVVLGFNLAT